MQCNTGTVDRIVRIIFGLLLLAYAIAEWNFIIGVISLIPIGTALLKFCPLYKVIGLNTGCRTQKN